MCTTLATVLYAGAASHVSRSVECTIHVFGLAGFPTTAHSCPRAIAFTTALWDTRAATAASLIDMYPATGRRSSAGPRASRCMPLHRGLFTLPLPADLVSTSLPLACAASGDAFVLGRPHTIYSIENGTSVGDAV
jgi:hypothetical protein